MMVGFVRRFLLFVTLAVAAAVVGCGGSEGFFTPAPAVYTDEATPPGTGALEVVVYRRVSDNRVQRVDRAEVAVFQTFDDVRNGVPLSFIRTSSTGTADFGYLNLGTYYVNVFKNENGENWELTEAAQVQINRRLTRNIILF
jgi:hypothetical protein